MPLQGERLEDRTLLAVEGFVTLGNLDDPALATSGDFAYVVDESVDLLQVIDVSTPDSPAVSGTVSPGDLSNPSVAAAGDFVFVVDDATDQFQAINVGTPSNPVVAAGIGLGNLADPVLAVSGDFAYVVDEALDQLQVIDISTPGSPSVSGTVGLGTLDDPALAVSGSFVFVVDETVDRLQVVDVGTPASPVVSGSVSLGNLSDPVVAVSGNRAYVVDNQGPFQVVDLSTPGSPTVTGTFAFGRFFAPKIVASGGSAYVVDAGIDQVQVFDLATPDSPQLSGGFELHAVAFPALAVSGDFAYVVDQARDRLQVIDVSSPSFAPAVGVALLGDVADTSMKLAGDFAYVVDETADLLQVIDISDPTGPTVTGTVGLGNTGDPTLAVSGNFAYVVDDFVRRVQVVDISNAASPSVAGTLHMGVLNDPAIAVSGNFAFVVDEFNDTLQVVDVSNPAGMSVSATLGLGGLDDPEIVVSGNFAYVADVTTDQLQVIDISTPTGPSVTTTLPLGDLVHVTMDVSGNFIYLNDNGGPLQVIDISTPASPDVAGTISLGLTLDSNVVAAGDFAFVVDDNLKRLQVVDVSTPASPVLSGIIPVGNVNTTIGGGSLAASGNFVFLADASLDRLQVFDIASRSSAPATGVATLGDLGEPALALSGDVVFVADDSVDQLQVIDVSTPAGPVVTATVDLGDLASPSVAASGGFAYVADRNTDQFQVIDATNPAAPVIAATLPIAGLGTPAVVASGDFAYVADGDTDRLRVIDVSNPSSPVERGSVSLGRVISVSLDVVGTYAYVVDASREHLQVIDVSIPNNPSVAGSVQIPASNMFSPSVAVSGNFAYIVDGNLNHIQVVDVSTPSNPVVGETLVTGDLGDTSLAVSGNFLYLISDGDLDEVQVVDLSSPASPVLVKTVILGNVNMPTSGGGLAAAGDFAYVVDTFFDRLQIVDVSVPQPPTTSVSLSGADLLIEDSNGANTDDTLTLSTDGTDIIIHDPDNLLTTSIAGASGDGTNTIHVPLATAGFTGDIIVNTLGGDDRLTVDFGGGADFGRAISYRGGTQNTNPGGDSLALLGGGTFAAATYNFDNLTDGSIDVTGNSRISYIELEPIVSDITATNVTLNYSDASETIELTDATGGKTTVTSTVGETLTFNNPLGTLAINAGDTGDDIVNIASLAADFPADLVIDGEGGTDDVNVNGEISFADNKSVTLSADEVDIDAAVTTAGTGDITVTAASVDLGSTIRGTGDLILQPGSSSRSIGLGGGAGDFNLSDGELANLVDGFNAIRIGRLDGTGTVSLETATFNDPVTISGGTINDATGTDLTAPSVNLAGDVAPGQSPGILNISGNAVLDDSASFNVEIGGTAAGEGTGKHDQLSAMGTVSIGTGVSLNTSAFDDGSDFVPSVGDSFTIVSRTGGTGRFDGLPDGAMIIGFLGSPLNALISYAGGSGHDVVLTVINPPPLTVSLAAGSILENGGTTTATVSRPNSVGEVTVNLASSDTGDADVPATVTIADGQTSSAPFTITGVDDTLIDGTQTVTITAGATGYTDDTETIDVLDDEIDLRFDFGTSASPVATDYLQVLTTSAFPASPVIGDYGWASLSGLSDRDRTFVSSDLKRDYVKSANASTTFRVSVPNGDYNVKFTIGSGADPRNNVGVALEGTLVASVSTLPGQFATAAHMVTVSDGLLDVELQKNGATATGINELAITSFTFEPVIDATDDPLFYDVGDPAVVIDAALNLTDPDDVELASAAVRIVDGFDQASDVLSFTNLHNITGDYNAATGVLTLTGPDTVAHFEDALRSVKFESASGTLGARVIEFSATDDSDTGEAGRSLTVLSGELLQFDFDFGTPSSAVETDFTGVEITDAFNPLAGFGWLDDAFSNGLTHRNRTVPDDLRADYHKIGSGSMTFAVNVPNGDYFVTSILGSNADHRDGVGVIYEGTQVATVSTNAGQFAEIRERVTVSDGRLDVKVARQGASGASLNALRILEATNAPEVTPTVGPLFYELGAPAAVVDDALSITDPNDTTISEATVSITDGFVQGQDELDFTPGIGVTGSYDASTGELSLTGDSSVDSYQTVLRTVTYRNNGGSAASTREVTFAVTDASGDTGTGSREIGLQAPFPGSVFYDFGTTTSPVHPGFVGVNETTSFSAATGYGWLNTVGIESRNRLAPVPLNQRRDYVKLGAGSMTFAASVPNGDYDVEVTVGSSENARSGVGIIMEGTQVTTINVPKLVFAVETHRVTVVDSRLEVEIARQGASAAGINALRIVAVT